MASTYSDLKIELIGTGDQSGTWGVTTNTNLGNSALGEAITGSATVTFASADITLTLTDTNASQTARNLRLHLDGTSGGARNLILGSGCQIEKLYLVNNTCADAVTIKNTTGTGITIPAGKTMFVFNNGTNITEGTNYAASLTLGTALSTANGGTGVTSSTFCNLGANVTGTLPIANGGTGSTSTTYVNLTSNVTGTLPVGNGGTGLTTFTAGTTYVAPATATTFTAQQTFAGTSSVIAAVFSDAAEVATISATAATGTINYDVTTQSVLYYTSNAAANWTLNFRASSGTTLNTVLAAGQSVTVAFLVTQGSTAYYNNVVQVDGSTVTPKWQGGTAPTAGNASSIDVYQYTIVKTASATFTVLASITKYA